MHYEVHPTLLDGKCRHGVYTTIMEESYRRGLWLKTHGDPKKIDFNVCWVSKE